MKLDKRIDVVVSEELEERVIALALFDGVSKSEWVRDLIERTLYGEWPVMQSLVERRRGRNGKIMGSDE